jgi:molybdate transport system substrate-binding protein
MRGSSKIAMWVSAVLLGGVTASGAQAVEIRLISAGAVRAVVSSLSESFTQETGHSVQATFGTMGVVRQKLAADPADVVIASDTVLDQLLQQGVIVTGTRTDLARAGVGVGVRDGAPKPDISTPDAFKQTLLAAKSLVYVDPAQGATSGIHFAGVLQRLGIADAVKSKTILWPGGYAAEAVAKGDAEIVVHQISEIMPVKGVTLVGPLPKDLQKITIYSAGVATKSTATDAAKTFITYLIRPASKAKFAAAGLDYKEN